MGAIFLASFVGGGKPRQSQRPSAFRGLEDGVGVGEAAPETNLPALSKTEWPICFPLESYLYTILLITASSFPRCVSSSSRPAASYLYMLLKRNFSSGPKTTPLANRPASPI